MNQTDRAIKIIQILREATQGMTPAASDTILDRYGRDPFLMLISCLLSLRTKDTVSLPASLRLFEQATTPSQMLNLSLSEIEKLIYPCGFYRNKAKSIQYVSRQIIEQFEGKVPATRQELLNLKGVGPKTAALVLAQGFGIPAICVDTHVHRISNRLGLVNTKTSEETEEALMRVLPQEFWGEYSQLLVVWGQNICVPISPFCSKCVLFDVCERKGVTKSR
jgi:endonuclease-3